MITKHVAKSSKSVKAKPFGCSFLAALTALELFAEPGGGDDGGRQKPPLPPAGLSSKGWDNRLATPGRILPYFW
jgi:hypothetical protein